MFPVFPLPVLQVSKKRKRARSGCCEGDKKSKMTLGMVLTLITFITAKASDACSGLATVASISVGEQHTCAFLSSGIVECWGEGSAGELGRTGSTATVGDGSGVTVQSLTAIDLAVADSAVAVSVAGGGGFTCVVMEDGSVKCFGQNSSGQLGLGITDATVTTATDAVELGSGRSVTYLSAGVSHVCAILEYGTKCWGENGDGQLGLGDTADRGSLASDMGDSLPTVDFGGSNYATVIAAGYYHTCAALGDGTAKCWGNNEYGQLGQGDTVSRGGTAGSMGTSLPAIDLGTGVNVTSVAVGRYHSCALLTTATADGVVKCWGNNNRGQLGQGDNQNRGGSSGTMGDSLSPIDLGTGAVAVDIAAGRLFTCALLDTAEVVCWGYNSYGQLGVEDDASRGADASDMGNALGRVDLGEGRSATAFATAHGQHVCALLDDYSVKCWGDNESGQLGLDDTTNRGDLSNSMGDYLPTVDIDEACTLTSEVKTQNNNKNDDMRMWLITLSIFGVVIFGFFMYLFCVDPWHIRQHVFHLGHHDRGPPRRVAPEVAQAQPVESEIKGNSWLLSTFQLPYHFQRGKWTGNVSGGNNNTNELGSTGMGGTSDPLRAAYQDKVTTLNDPEAVQKFNLSGTGDTNLKGTGETMLHDVEEGEVTATEHSECGVTGGGGGGRRLEGVKKDGGAFKAKVEDDLVLETMFFEEGGVVLTPLRPRQAAKLAPKTASNSKSDEESGGGGAGGDGNADGKLSIKDIFEDD